MSWDTASEQENSCKTITDTSGKMEVPDIVRMEKESNQDKKGPLSWNNYLEPNNTTTAEKEDDTGFGS